MSTSVSRQIDAADAVLLVDNATEPMQAAPIAAMSEIVTTGNTRKLILAFTHFDQVKGDNLPNAAAKALHVLASAENVLEAFGVEHGPFGERALRQRLEEARFFGMEQIAPGRNRNRPRRRSETPTTPLRTK